MSRRICPACGVSHERDTYAGCCSRGCMRFHQRRNPLPKRMAPKPAAVESPRPKPVIHVDPPPPIEVVFTCLDCKRPTPDWAAYECSGGHRCVGCWLEWKERQRARDDVAVPGSPFMGGGVRVIRSTKGL